MAGTNSGRASGELTGRLLCVTSCACAWLCLVVVVVVVVWVQSRPPQVAEAEVARLKAKIADVVAAQEVRGVGRKKVCDSRGCAHHACLRSTGAEGPFVQPVRTRY